MISLTVLRSSLDALGLNPRNVDLHVLDPSARPPVWRRAGDAYVGRSDPTEIVGEYGYQVVGDRAMFWAVRSELSSFAAGVSQFGPSRVESDDDIQTQPDRDDVVDDVSQPNPDDPMPVDNVVEPSQDDEPSPSSPTPSGGLCGVMGMIQFTLMLSCLLTMRVYDYATHSRTPWTLRFSLLKKRTPGLVGANRRFTIESRTNDRLRPVAVRIQKRKGRLAKLYNTLNDT